MIKAPTTIRPISVLSIVLKRYLKPIHMNAIVATPIETPFKILITISTDSFALSKPCAKAGVAKVKRTATRMLSRDNIFCLFITNSLRSKFDVDGFNGEVRFYKIDCPIHTPPTARGIPLLAGNQYSLLRTIQKDAERLSGGELKFGAIKRWVNATLLDDVDW